MVGAGLLLLLFIISCIPSRQTGCRRSSSPRIVLVLLSRAKLIACAFWYWYQYRYTVDYPSTVHQRGMLAHLNMLLCVPHSSTTTIYILPDYIVWIGIWNLVSTHLSYPINRGPKLFWYISYVIRTRRTNSSWSAWGVCVWVDIAVRGPWEE